MKYRIYKEACKTAGSPAGEEGRLVSFPHQRPFLWQLRIQYMEREAAELSGMPQYERVMLVLEGDIILAYEGQRVVRLKELEQDRFDGGFSAKSFGKAQVYDLLVRKGAAGYLDVLELTEENRVPERENPEGRKHICQAFYCREGCGVVSVAGQSCMIRQGQQLVICQDSGEELDAGVMGEGTLIRAQIFYDCKEGAESDIPAAAADRKETQAQAESLKQTGLQKAGRKESAEPEKKGGFADFLGCMKLSLRKFLR